MSRVTEDRLEDRSSQCEATKSSFRQQGWSTPTESGINNCEQRLFYISSASTSGAW